MQTALIAPASMIPSVSIYSDYFMTLPRALSSQLYVHELQQVRARRKIFLILDNGLSEERKPLSPSGLLELASNIVPDEVVMPDYLRDATLTVTKTLECASLFRENGYEGKLMGVAQGRTLEEYIDCIYGLVEIPGITTIGLSKYFKEITGSPRRNLLSRIDCYGIYRRDIEWHLLGLEETFEELSEIAVNFPWLRGIDTCLPVLAGMRGLDLTRPGECSLVEERNSGLFNLPRKYFEARVDDYILWDDVTESQVFHAVDRNVTAFITAAVGLYLTPASEL